MEEENKDKLDNKKFKSFKSFVKNANTEFLTLFFNKKFNKDLIFSSIVDIFPLYIPLKPHNRPLSLKAFRVVLLELFNISFKNLLKRNVKGC